MQSVRLSGEDYGDFGRALMATSSHWRSKRKQDVASRRWNDVTAMTTSIRQPAARSILGKILRLSLSDMGLLAEAWAVLAFSSVAIRAAPFMQVGQLASWPLGRRPESPGREDVLAKVAWAVRACARRAPWRAVCFQQGLAAQIMLRRRGVPSTLFFGAAVDRATGLNAHVWVRDGARDVIGCEQAPGFAVLASFPPEPGGRAPGRDEGRRLA